MASTDTKPGFRLPWSADRNGSVSETEMQEDAPDPSAAALGATGDATNPPQGIETPAMIDAAPATTTAEAAVDAHGAEADLTTRPTPTPAAPATPRKPNKFMADLTRAMQAAAESARTDALERVAAEAKLKVEAIHADSAGEATELRKRADDDVATVREWSKAEIARIREETDERIAHRKQRLEHEIEAHGAAIEARIERVQTRVSAYEAEMEAFFDRLRAEQDPTHFAAMAESLPEPPPFDTADDVDLAVASEVAAAAPSAVATEPSAPSESIESHDETVAVADAVTSVHPSDDEGADLFSIGSDAPSTADDPRLSALGLSADFAAAEAEAAAFDPDDEGSDEPMSDIPDEAIAARLAGLGLDNEGPAADIATTRLVVTGLISVASIAGFKRHLTRAGGVQTVGVSSGPDGEFVFNVGHDTSVAMKDVVASLPGFAARVTSEGDGELSVSAHDPETGG